MHRRGQCEQTQNKYQKVNEDKGAQKRPKNKKKTAATNKPKEVPKKGTYR